jgi:pimeloyl-ACP methyl ester carboxylesterase
MAELKPSSGGPTEPESAGDLHHHGGPVVARQHGSAPFHVVVVHGGPGAAGELAPGARRLAASRGTLEPIQTATTVDGQVEELRAAIQSRADPPVVLVGHSWGAWLSGILAARYPRLVRKLILIGTGPFEEHYVPMLRETRLQRLTPNERDEFRCLMDLLAGLEANAPVGWLQRLGELGAKTDTYAPIDPDRSIGALQPDLPPRSIKRHHVRGRVA